MKCQDWIYIKIIEFISSLQICIANQYVSNHPSQRTEQPRVQTNGYQRILVHLKNVQIPAIVCQFSSQQPKCYAKNRYVRWKFISLEFFTLRFFLLSFENILTKYFSTLWLKNFPDFRYHPDDTQKKFRDNGRMSCVSNWKESQKRHSVPNIYFMSQNCQKFEFIGSSLEKHRKSAARCRI